MYDLIESIIGHTWVQGGNDQQYIYYICGALIIVLTIVFVDIIRDIFRSFIWRG